MADYGLTLLKVVFAVVQISSLLRVLTSFEYLKRISIAFVIVFISLIALLNVFLFPVHDLEFNSNLYFLLIWGPIMLVFLTVAKYKDGRFLFSLAMADSAVLIVYGTGYWLGKFVDHLAIIYLVQFLMLIAIYGYISKFYRPKLLIAQDTLNANWGVMCIRPLTQNILLHIALVNNTDIDPVMDWVLLFLYLLLFIQFGVTFKSFGNFIDFAQLKEENEQLSQQLKTQLEDNKDLVKKEDALKMLRHDLRHHMTNLYLMISNKQSKLALEYIERFQLDISQTQTKMYCENVIINALLSHFILKAQKEGIQVVTSIHLPRVIHVNEIDLSVIFSNAIENAINANRKIEDRSLREMAIKCTTTVHDIKITIQNPNFIEVEFENGLPVSHEKDHGFGTKSMDMLARKFNGTVSFDQSDNIFTCVVYLENKKL